MKSPRLDPPARVLVTKIGLDGHDRGSRIVAAFLRDAGMDVIYTPPWQSIAGVVKLATEEDVDTIGVSSLATDHLIVPQLVEALREAGLGHVGVVVGGIVPADEQPALIAAGVSAIFGPGASRDDIVEHVAALAAQSREARDAELREWTRMTKEAVQLPLPGFDQDFAQWRADYSKQIGADRRIVNRSGIEIKSLYTPRDWDGSAYETDLGFPGQYPYTRGIYPTMHRGRTWSQRQLIGLGTPEDYNARVRQILAAGATAISFLPCNSGFRGVDCDEVDPLLLGTCGTVSNTVGRHGRRSRRRPARRNFDCDERSLALHPARLHAGRSETSRHRMGSDFRHFQSERLYLPFHRQPYVLPAVVAGLASRLDRSRRFLSGAPAELEPDFGRRATYAAGRRDTRRDGRLHLVDRAAICRGLRHARHRHRRPTASLHVLLRHLDQLLRGDRQVPRGAAYLGAPCPRAARREESQFLALQVPRPDVRRRPHASAAAQQHRARRDAGDGGHPERPAIDAHRRL